MPGGDTLLAFLFAAIGLGQLAPPLASWWQRARYRRKAPVLPAPPPPLTSARSRPPATPLAHVTPDAPPPAPTALPPPAPPVHLVVPCKGGGEHLARHLAAFAAQRYRPLLVSFVTESATDAAVPPIAELAARHRHVRHVVAGLAGAGSQKIHNLLAAADTAPAQAEVFAFCDSDVEPHPDLLRHLVGALVAHGVTVTTGYRWLAPAAPGLAARVHTVLSAYLATLAAWPTSRVVWGGTWAIRRNDWQRLQVAAYWRRRLSDDLALQTLLQRHGARREFVPWCVSPTQEAIARWPELIDWFSRQVYYVRLYTPSWWRAAVAALLLLATAAAAALAVLAAALAGAAPGAGPAAGAAALLLALLAAPLLIIAPRPGPVTFAPLQWVALAPLAGAVALVSAVRSLFMRRVTWADVTYTFNRDGTVKGIARRA